YARFVAISKPPGSTAPGGANATLSPASKLTAPQMTPKGLPGPVDTWQYLTGLRKPVSSSISVTCPTTTPRMSWPTGSTDSTSSPTAVSRRATSPAGTDESTAAYSRSQDSGTRISPPLRVPG